MKTEVADRGGRLEEFARRSRDQNLPTVSGRGDPRRLVDVDPAVMAVDDEGLTRVVTHAHVQTPFVERGLRFTRRGDRLPCTSKDREKGIAFGVHLNPVVRGDRVTNQLTVLDERCPKRSGPSSRSSAVDRSISAKNSVIVPVGSMRMTGPDDRGG
jgi:hypothetical protein